MRDSFSRLKKFMEECREITMSDVGFRCAIKERWFLLKAWYLFFGLLGQAGLIRSSNWKPTQSVKRYEQVTSPTRHAPTNHQLCVRLQTSQRPRSL